MSYLQLFIALIPYLFAQGVVSTTFTITNECEYTIWPGILSNAGAPTLSPTGFPLQQGQSKTITAPSSWAGRIWARTYCSSTSTGQLTCVTGDCSSASIECSGNGAIPPATLAEFTLDGYGGQDFYDVSLVDGYNLPVLVSPQGGTGQKCTATGCVVDLNEPCPSELKVTSVDGESVACKSACDAFQQPEYCCSGAYDSPATCKPSFYSEIFKSACPHAYSYAFDDVTSTFTCSSSPDYIVTFCPSPSTTQKASQAQTSDTTSSSSTGSSSLIHNSTVVYEGVDQSCAPLSTCSQVLLGVVSVTFAIWHSS